MHIYLRVGRFNLWLNEGGCVFVIGYSCPNFLRCLANISLWTVSAKYHVNGIFCFSGCCFVFVFCDYELSLYIYTHTYSSLKL